jgi:hypothetical protein
MKRAKEQLLANPAFFKDKGRATFLWNYSLLERIGQK